MGEGGAAKWVGGATRWVGGAAEMWVGLLRIGGRWGKAWVGLLGQRSLGWATRCGGWGFGIHVHVHVHVHGMQCIIPMCTCTCTLPSHRVWQ